MSRTYCIACLTCRKRLSIGQGCPQRPDDRYIYSYPEAMKALGDFLYAHGRTGATPAEGREHVLVFSDDEWPEVAELDEIELPESQSGISREEAIRLGQIEPSRRCMRMLFGRQCVKLESHNPPCIYDAIEVAE